MRHLSLTEVSELVADKARHRSLLVSLLKEMLTCLFSFEAQASISLYGSQKFLLEAFLSPQVFG